MKVFKNKKQLTALGLGVAVGAGVALTVHFQRVANVESQKECAVLTAAEYNRFAPFAGGNDFYRDPAIQENFNRDYCACVAQKISPDFKCQGVQFKFD